MRPVITPRRLAGTIAAAVLATTALAPAAHAAIPATVTSASWDVRTSWVNYVTNPSWALGASQGSVARTASNGGTSSVAPGSAFTTWSSPYTNYAYSYRFAKSPDAGTPRTVTLRGGLRFQLPLHGVDVSLADLRVVDATGPEKLLVDATYRPVGGATQTQADSHAFDVADTPDGSGAHTVTLTAAGAQIFNGGSNGSYAAGDAFGTLRYP